MRLNVLSNTTTTPGYTSVLQHGLISLICRVSGMIGYLLSVAVELAQDVEQRNLWDDQLLLLILIQRSSWQVKGQEQEGGL